MASKKKKSVHFQSSTTKKTKIESETESEEQYEESENQYKDQYEKLEMFSDEDDEFDENELENGSNDDVESNVNDEDEYNDEEEDIEDNDIINDNVYVGFEDPKTMEISSVQQRIQQTVEALSDWKSNSDKYKSRNQAVNGLYADLAHYYSYSLYMIQKLGEIFGSGRELVEFLEANETPRPVTIRVNTLKTRRRDLAQALISRGVNLDPIDKWSNVGLQIFDSPVPIGATPEYLAGHYMLQSAASFLPVVAMGNVEEGERVLDMCAAPGGKTTYLAAVMKNSGTLFANDVSKDRLKSLMANIHRMGVTNCVVTNLDGRLLPKQIKGFSKILLDAPCSGTGVISKDPAVKVSKTEDDFVMLTKLQKELLTAAVEAADINATIIYSTCSITIEENEQVVDHVLKKNPNLKLVETGIEFGKEGFTSFRGKHFHPSLKLTRRFYPHVNNMDGFFVAKIVKKK